MVIKRILASKKFWEGIVPNVIGIAAVFGMDLPASLEATILAGFSAAAVVLVYVQGQLDVRFGSPSDSTVGQ